MKHANQITYADAVEGMTFKYDDVKWDAAAKKFAAKETTGTITGIRTTKTGRVMLTVDGKQWSNAPCKSTTTLQAIC